MRQVSDGELVREVRWTSGQTSGKAGGQGGRWRPQLQAMHSHVTVFSQAALSAVDSQMSRPYIAAIADAAAPETTKTQRQTPEKQK